MRLKLSDTSSSFQDHTNCTGEKVFETVNDCQSLEGQSRVLNLLLTYVIATSASQPAYC